MSKKQKYAIVIKRNNKFCHAMNIIFTKDGSIYFSFPHSKGWKIQKYLNKRFQIATFRGKKTRLFSYEAINKEPKISFHPREKIVHVNSNNTGRVSEDYQLLNVSRYKDQLFCYLLQVSFPDDPNEYDEFVGNVIDPYKSFVIDYTPVNDHLVIEFILHTKFESVTPLDLPESKVRTFRFWRQFYSEYSPYMLSVFVSTFNTEINKDVTICLNTKSNALFYKLVHETDSIVDSEILK